MSECSQVIELPEELLESLEACACGCQGDAGAGGGSKPVATHK